MNHMSGINRKLNTNDGRQIVDYINKRIKEKADMERRGVPFFKADNEAFASQDVKRLTILDKVYKHKTTPFKLKRVKECKMTTSKKPIWWELTGFMKPIKKETKVAKIDQKEEHMFNQDDDDDGYEDENEDEDEDEEPFSFRINNIIENF
ncbi:putative DNA helicase INO80 [Tetranychus urticae]|uniref:putative DNA helicase INO80 n=1 Tax=Tetranychus urticae TaxID=32264 RepID=UPI00077B8F84|nr:putative DNA helicase INO80 [Tetranychus urticae]